MVNQSGGNDLDELVKNMSPDLRPGEYVFLSFQDGLYGDHSDLQPIASFLEQEGLTLIVPKENADSHQQAYSSVFRCITLQVHSSLEAVGLTKVFATQLTKYGISANVIAGFYHDHIFVGVGDAQTAMDALRELSSVA